MEGRCVHLAGKLIGEAEALEGLELGLKRPLDEVLAALRKGGWLLKHGRHGKPKVHFFRLAAADNALRWRSASGSVKGVRLRNVVEVLPGQQTEVFRKKPLREEALSFSLAYMDDDGGARTLDLTCPDQASRQCGRIHYEVWLSGLRVVVARLRAAGTHATASAAAVDASQHSFCFYSSPADAVRGLAASADSVRLPPHLALPPPDRPPGDLLAWGAAQRAAPAHSSRSGLGGAEDCWQHSTVPVVPGFNAALDVHRAAVGRKHGALVTATGVLYTWGEGRGGKLGLGHDQDRSTPARLTQGGLGGQCVVAVACGDDCTAAITASGTLYMWGWLPGASTSRSMLVPGLVRGGLAGKRVVQVSCGPFHCAAVTSDGQLFTWGEGFGGKLGHGDQLCRAHPTFVSTLAGVRVLEAACGVWHTAAIAVESSDGAVVAALDGAAAAASAGSSALRVEASAPDVLMGGAHAAPAAEGALPSTPMRAHHARNSSASSAFSDNSLFHEGAGGALYTWGGVSESVVFGGEGEAKEKRDSNKGCLGHGYDDLYRGRLLPERVHGALEARAVRHVAAGLHLTVAVTTGGRVFQMGVTGAAAGKGCPWEGAVLPELVRGALAGLFVDEVACGMHHAVAVARQSDRKTGRPLEHGPSLVLAWGRGSEGQLGARGHDDSAAPLVVDALKGRAVLGVACGSCNTLAVCENDPRRFESDCREEAEAAQRALAGVAEGRPPTAPGLGGRSSRGPSQQHAGVAASSGSSLSSMVRRTFSGAATHPAPHPVPPSSNGSLHGGSVAALGPWPTGPGSLARMSSSSVRSASGRGAQGQPPQAAAQPYASLTSANAGQRAPSRASTQPRSLRGRPSSERGLSNGGGEAAHAGSGGPGRLVTLSPGGPSQPQSTLRRSLLASRSFTAHSHLSHASELSSLSSQARPLSDDGCEVESYCGGGALTSAELAAIDEIRSNSSVATLQEELGEKNRLIERLEARLAKMQRQAARGAAAGDGDERLREAVRSSAGQFREAAQAQAQSAAAAAAAVPPPGGWEATAAAAGRRAGAWQASPSKASPRAGRALVSFGEAGPSQLSEDAGPNLRAMEAELARRQAALESQQRQLALWAAELARREAELAQRQGGAAPPAATQQPSPPGAAAARAQAVPQQSPLVQRALAGEPPFALAMGTPKHLSRQASGGEDAAACAPVAAAAQGGECVPHEWTEEFEEGVWTTWQQDDRGGKKLRRIRFSRTLFDKERASQWYERNKERLATSKLSEQAAQAPAAAAEVPDAAAGSAGAAAPGVGPASAATGAAAEPGASSDAEQQLLSRLHYRQTSRNLSFDARDLADFHSRLAAAPSAGAAKPLSRLSQASRPHGGGEGTLAAPLPEGEGDSEPSASSPFRSARGEGAEDRDDSNSTSSPARASAAAAAAEASFASGWHSASSSPHGMQQQQQRGGSSSPHSRRPSASPGGLGRHSRQESGVPAELLSPASAPALGEDGGSRPSSPIRAALGSSGSGAGSRGSSPGKARGGLPPPPRGSLAGTKSDAARLAQALVQQPDKAQFSPRFPQQQQQHFLATSGAVPAAAATAAGTSPAGSSEGRASSAPSPKSPGGLSGTVSRLKAAITSAGSSLRK